MAWPSPSSSNTSLDGLPLVDSIAFLDWPILSLRFEMNDDEGSDASSSVWSTRLSVMKSSSSPPGAGAAAPTRLDSPLAPSPSPSPSSSSEPWSMSLV